ncbi:threonine aldolase [Plectosphaerella plurivora]|uniref:Threonine aldolase n=1 Tax=Plectosphaerella plurivora TaxID=936078 RepID=A0A9P8VGQ2_9PEZI|nr:threonine aldolase [Plectosphaerella plurivora]
MARCSFLDDYTEGAHPKILEALSSTNMSSQQPYGEDEYSSKAKEYIRDATGGGVPTSSIHFVVSGTLANIISIGSCLRPHEAVIASDIGHIVVREAGAIEATGHKLITVPHAPGGKLTVDSIQAALDKNAHFPHMAKPRMVYLSNATELGTVYTKPELSAISRFCGGRGLLLFLDGARLAAASAAVHTDSILNMKDIAELTDMFWIGGTKVGALLGEAIVISNQALAADFVFHVKQRGGLLAKGRILGVQFMELFRPNPAGSNLFFDLAAHANQMAALLSSGIAEAGHKLAATTETNQVFPILPNDLITMLQESYSFYVWEKAADGDSSVIRLVTSWATDQKQVKAFISAVQSWN